MKKYQVYMEDWKGICEDDWFDTEEEAEKYCDYQNNIAYEEVFFYEEVEVNE